jgi:hypothetical protein
MGREALEMKLEEFVNGVMSEEIEVVVGVKEGDAYGSTAADPDDLTDEDIAAEAIGQRVEGLEGMSFEEIVKRVHELREGDDDEEVGDE